MKHTLFLILFCSSLHGISQDSLYFRSSIGLDITSTLKNVLTFNTESIVPYSMVYKHAFNRNYGIRLGASFGFFKEEDVSDQFFSIRTTTMHHVSLRVGFEKYYALKNNFYFFWGMDVLGSYQKEIGEVDDFTREISVTEELDYGIGAGPILGIEYMINRFMKIGTESTIYAIFTQSTTKTSGGLIPEMSFSTNDFELRHILPQSLYFYILF